MTPEESFEIEKSKGYLVVKSNDLIQRNRFELSLPEQKTVAYICSMIQPMQTEESGFQLEYEFKIREYCKICGIDYDNGKNYQDVKATLKKLRDKSTGRGSVQPGREHHHRRMPARVFHAGDHREDPGSVECRETQLRRAGSVRTVYIGQSGNRSAADPVPETRRQRGYGKSRSDPGKTESCYGCRKRRRGKSRRSCCRCRAKRRDYVRRLWKNAVPGR